MKALSLVLCATLFGFAAAFGQTGKIAGRVTDATGQALPGANVIIVGTTQGVASNVDGYYTILNVGPSVYTVRASIVGFTTIVTENVRVRIGETTEVNFALREAIVDGEEVVVTAQAPIVQADVSNSRLNVSSEEIEVLPVSSVAGVVGLQAGIQGLSIRGSGSSELLVMVNGVQMRDERDNTPYSDFSLASVEEVQVQTGGFNAEYGSARSGVINIVTKAGSKDRYNADFIFRYSPPAQKHFGHRADDPNAFWIRPYLDPDVAWTGTENGAWDEAMQRQYPTFEGWVAVANGLLADDDPTNDMTPEALQQAFLWQHRKSMETTIPDYNVDVGFGGPVPLVGKALGGMRFYASYRRDEEAYLIPLHTDRFESWTGHVKLTSNVSPAITLSLEGLAGEQFGTASSRAGAPGVFRSASSIAQQLTNVSFIDTRIFSTDYWTPTRVNSLSLGAKWTHVLNETTFYEAWLSAFDSKYDTNPGRLRDETPIVTFGGVGFDEAPFGFQPAPAFGVGGMRTGVGMSNSRDSSRVTTYNTKVDFTSQVHPFFQLKSGVEYNLTDSRVNYAQFDAFLRSGNSNSRWEETPSRGAAYVQGRLEFQGMIANLGLRAEYFGPGGEWWVFDPYDRALSAASSDGIDTLLNREPIESQLDLSPRLGVSFPVTERSKLYFNYGHFRSLPDPDNLFLFRQSGETGQVIRVASPDNPLPKTVSYEVGYEQALFDEYLIKAAGYYKDVTLQPFLVEYISRDGSVNYNVSESNSFEDIRGFELTLSKNRGRWLRGFVNYTYMVYTEGYFGLRRNFENPTAQREFAESDDERRRASTKPVPQPYGRINVDLLTPASLGPEMGGLRPAGDWTVSMIAFWQKGPKFTWTGGGAIPGVLNNVSVRDSWDVDLRIAKNFEIGGRRAQFFIDIFNVLNRRQFASPAALANNGFRDGNDLNDYLRSLHLPESDDYTTNIPGSDKVGDYRDFDVPFRPMVRIPTRESVTNPVDGTIYWENDTRSYLVFENGGWANADQSLVNEIIESKAYIDMPNQQYLTFLNPRDVYFGIRVSL
ncbi:MAG TPA: TonB-dependent receptor [Rhodothermales bacterium]|nr:TonB-dependent receptor [Rhodothermales bacterium]